MITGSGRAGTSFLVRLLTRMGYDTGYDSINDGFTPEIRAGCEYGGIVRGTADDIRETWSQFPQIVKTPSMAFSLKTLLSLGCRLDYVILPVRDFDDVLQSRLALATEHPVLVSHGWGHPDKAAIAVGKVIEACVLYSVPIVAMRYPDLVADSTYCRNALRKVFPDLAERGEEFDTVFDSLRLPGVVDAASRR